MRKNIILFILIIGFVSCRKGVNQSFAEYIIYVDSLSTELPPIKSIRYIPLETTDASLIRNINKIIVRDSVYYIFDNLSKKILLFNKRGRFIKSINKVGQGPGEYIYPSDIDVDKEGNIYLSDFQSKNIIKYCFGNENDFEILDVGESFMDFVIQGQYIYLSRLAREGTLDINLARWNMDSQEIEILKENELIEGNSIGFADHYFYRTGNEYAFYYERFHRIGYQIVGDSLREYISFESASFPTDDEVKKQAKLPKEKRNIDFASLDISACYETEKYLLITFNTTPFHTYSLVNKMTKVVYSVNSFQEVGVLGYEICASTGEDFISYFLPNDMNIRQIQRMSVDMDDINNECVTNLSVEDNPVLVLFSFD